MFVLCDNCNNHYDDSSQSPDCETGFPLADGGSVFVRHRQIDTSPVEDHVNALKSIRLAKARG